MAGHAFDIVLLGATGFTGRLTALYLARHGGAAKIALAGRSTAKLEAVRQEMAALDARFATMELLQLDSTDQAAVDDAVRRTRVVASTAGPFAQLGSNVVDACARLGRHYVDITGESTWVRAMIDQHHERAVQTGARIVPMCGFDSIPSDLGVAFLASVVRERHGQATLDGPVSALFRVSGGGPSGGTLASIANIIDTPGAGRDLARPFLLNPRSERPERPRASAFEADRRGVAYDSLTGSWTVPFVMAGVNSRVVRRSAALGRAYGPSFEYNEAAAVRGPVAGVLVMLALGLFFTLYYFRLTRALLLRFVLPAPGQGPSEARRASARFSTTLATRLANGGARVRVRVSGGDPGYDETAKMLGEAALLLAGTPDAQLGPAGLGTPATTLGMPLVTRLHRAGLRFEVVDE